MRNTMWNKRHVLLGLLAATGAGLAPRAQADTRLLIDDFSDGPNPGWSYVSDQVMGGVSTGGVEVLREDGQLFARLEGTVSTANNGGFIQMRRRLDASVPQGSNGLALRLRGNGARYYVHLRPRGTLRPWHYFAAGFDTSGVWQDIQLPWSSFTAQGGLRANFDPARITSLGVVAFGADYEARLDVARIEVI